MPIPRPYSPTGQLIDQHAGDAYERIGAATTTAEAMAALGDFATRYGFDTLQSPVGTGVDNMTLLTSLPQWFGEWYVHDRVFERDHLAAFVLTGRGVLTTGFSGDCITPQGLTPAQVATMKFVTNETGCKSYMVFPVYNAAGHTRGGVTYASSTDYTDIFERLNGVELSRLVLLGTHFNMRCQTLLALDDALPRPLSPRERECMQWLAAGKVTKEIGDLLHLSDSAVNLYVANAKRKLRADTREQAVARALLLGEISL